MGELEAAVMETLWDRGCPTTVRDALQLLGARQLAYTTVMPVMHNLHAKGMLTRTIVPPLLPSARADRRHSEWGATAARRCHHRNYYAA